MMPSLLFGMALRQARPELSDADIESILNGAKARLTGDTFTIPDLDRAIREEWIARGLEPFWQGSEAQNAGR